MDAELSRRVAQAAALLRAGGLVVYPTETFYGLGALASRADALARLAAAKLRPAGKALPLIAADLAQVESVAALDEVARRIAGRFWPGPLTLVLPAAPGLDAALTGGTGTVAVRVPGSEVARTLARLAGGPLVSTSANRSGEPSPVRAGELSPTLLAEVDGVLDAGPTPGGLPSTLEAMEPGGPRLLREGAVRFAEVQAAHAELGARGGG
jgi:L-threonylcarbamoyladenylate synthase